MQVGVRESVALARGTLLTLRGRSIAPDLVVCPSFVALSEVHKVLARSSVSMGAQNVFWEDHGAFTGETSARMLTELGVTYVIIGHSERRTLLGETDEMVQKKIVQALAHGLIPLVCVGETAEEHDQGLTQSHLQKQLIAAFDGVHIKHRSQLLIAYEPVWAIGSGRTPAVSEVISAHQYIRRLVSEFFSSVDSLSLSVLYGGSVDAENAYAFLREQEVDGVLVGGVSVKLNQFNDVIVAASEVLEAQSTHV